MRLRPTFQDILENRLPEEAWWREFTLSRTRAIHYTDLSLYEEWKFDYTPNRFLFNPINVVGAMGAGVAKEFARAYPEMSKVYLALCKSGCLNIGQVLIWKPIDNSVPAVINVPTKQHWANPSKLEYIEESLDAIYDYLLEKCASVYSPRLGCGKGGLKWDDVRPIVVEHFPVWECRLTICDGDLKFPKFNDKPASYMVLGEAVEV